MNNTIQRPKISRCFQRTGVGLIMLSVMACLTAAPTFGRYGFKETILVQCVQFRTPYDV